MFSVVTNFIMYLPQWISKQSLHTNSRTGDQVLKRSMMYCTSRNVGVLCKNILHVLGERVKSSRSAKASRRSYCAHHDIWSSSCYRPLRIGVIQNTFASYCAIMWESVIKLSYVNHQMDDLLIKQINFMLRALVPIAFAGLKLASWALKPKMYTPPSSLLGWMIILLQTVSYESSTKWQYHKYEQYYSKYSQHP